VPERLSKDQIEQLSSAQLRSLVQSDAHYNATATRNYGPLDPLSSEATEYVFACPGDGSGDIEGNSSGICQPRLVYTLPSHQQVSAVRGHAISLDKPCYFVACAGCGARGNPSLRNWRAVVDWNFQQASRGRGSLAKIPFFNLAGLAPADAQSHLESIHYDLALRKALAHKDREAGVDVGGAFRARIDAYLGWANVGLRLLKGSRRRTPAHNASTSELAAA
jgi:hypothetical protein